MRFVPSAPDATRPRLAIHRIPMAMGMKLVLIMDMCIFIGLQASGKSTFFRTHFAATHDYVSKDLLRNNRRPGRRQLQLVEEALRAGHSVVIDNTNPAVEDRAELIALGHRYHATVIGYFFTVNVKRSLQWNDLREGKARVPHIGIFSMLKKMTLPYIEEGFDQLYCVQAREGFHFDVTSWPADAPGEVRKPE